MPRTGIPWSRKAAIELFNKKVEGGSTNPLAFLYPHEIKMAELWAVCERDPALGPTLPNPKLKRTWDTLQSGLFAQHYLATFGHQITSAHRKELHHNPAWVAFARSLLESSREAILRRLEADGLDAFHDYVWARKEARLQGDYKETRVGAADHLDRIGATQKPQESVPNLVVVLQGRNFTADTLDKELPALSNEIVVEAEEASDG